jgi:Bacterial regulatory helix-turn-helix protein, lysR family
MWKQLSHHNHYFGGGRRRLRFARCYLYELLTGGNLTIAAQPYNLPSPLRAEYHEFVLGLPAAMVHDLHSHARTILDGSGIAEEPLQWQPPKEWVTADVWPGADLDLTDPAPLQRELKSGDPASRVARQHGLSMEHLRHVIRHHPLPGPEQPRHRSGAILVGGSSTRHHRRIGDVYHVNVVWLHEQYVTWRRSLADIAADIGCHSTTLGEFAKQHAIPIRPRGGGSNFIAPNAAPAHPATLPSPLREALTGQDARSRIDRFLLIAEHGTIRKAAAELGRSDTTLNKQLANLESRCGGPLFDRPPRRLGNLTQLGKQLREQARRYLLSPDPKVVPA